MIVYNLYYQPVIYLLSITLQNVDLLESDLLTDEYKIELLVRMITSNSHLINEYKIQYNSTIIKYLTLVKNRYPTAEVINKFIDDNLRRLCLLDEMGSVISDYHIGHIIRTRREEYALITLDYTNPTFKELWSSIPTDNENLLQYLNWLGVELPPVINNSYSLARILAMSEVPDVYRLLDEINRTNDYQSEIIYGIGVRYC